MFFFSGEEFSTSVQDEVTIQPGVTPSCFPVSFVDDSIVEDDEEFTIVLTTSDGAIRIPDSNTAITILNNDSKYAGVFTFDY